MGIQNLSNEYETKTDEELLRLALDSKQLTSEASMALDAELARRRIGSSGQLADFRDQEQQYEVQRAKEIGRLFLLAPFGIGRKRFGKADYIFQCGNRHRAIQDNRVHCFVLVSVDPDWNVPCAEKARIPVQRDNCRGKVSS